MNQDDTLTEDQRLDQQEAVFKEIDELLESVDEHLAHFLKMMADEDIDSTSDLADLEMMATLSKSAEHASASADGAAAPPAEPDPPIEAAPEATAESENAPEAEDAEDAPVAAATDPQTPVAEVSPAPEAATNDNAAEEVLKEAEKEVEPEGKTDIEVEEKGESAPVPVDAPTVDPAPASDAEIEPEEVAAADPINESSVPEQAAPAASDDPVPIAASADVSPPPAAKDNAAVEADATMNMSGLDDMLAESADRILEGSDDLADRPDPEAPSVVEQSAEVAPVAPAAPETEVLTQDEVSDVDVESAPSPEPVQSEPAVESKEPVAPVAETTTPEPEPPVATPIQQDQVVVEISPPSLGVVGRVIEEDSKVGQALLRGLEITRTTINITQRVWAAIPFKDVPLLGVRMVCAYINSPWAKMSRDTRMSVHIISAASATMGLLALGLALNRMM